MYERLLKNSLKKELFRGKALFVVGARQVGKTTLIKDILQERPTSVIKTYNGDDPNDRLLLSEKGLDFLRPLVKDADIIFIDEAQKISNVGQTLKLLVDYYKEQKQIFVTGSSSMHLLNNVQESLTGRKFVYTLYPLSLEEVYLKSDYLTIYKEREQYLVFGMYPEVMQQDSFTRKQQVLKEIHDGYLYKDIFEMEKVKYPSKIVDLLKALAFQIGSEVSYTELAKTLGMNKVTVEHYIDLLEKNFIIFRLAAYSKNKRKEIAKLKKIYFYDVGIRNAVIGNFDFLSDRNDVGALWENFLIVERMKYRAYHNINASQYFWRSYGGAEVDLVEERGGKLYGFESKWNEKKTSRKAPKAWQEYEGSYKVITPRNLDGFVF